MNRHTILGDAWQQWVTTIVALVGIDTAEQEVVLLAPLFGQSDLSESQAQDLADAIHSALFCRGCSPESRLQRLLIEPAQLSLPLLYYSAWMLRNQEHSRAFWSSFCSHVVRERLAQATVQQRLAPLISRLWNNAHLQLSLYRPAETALVHVKWPHAHAGIVSSDLERLAALLWRCPIEDGMPSILRKEPHDFLSQVRIMTRDTSLSRRLTQVIHGPDKFALVIAELARSRLQELWPLTSAPVEKGPSLQIMAPRLQLDVDRQRIGVELPNGVVEGSHIVVGSYANEPIELESLYFEADEVTRYKGYTWPVSDIPWKTDFHLRFAHTSLAIQLPAECPFRIGSSHGALLFDGDSHYLSKKWWPGREYYLVLPTDSLPAWAETLFIDAEHVTSFVLGGVRLHVFGIRGKGLLQQLDQSTLSELLFDLETQLERERAMISLPSTRELEGTRIALRGGLIERTGQVPAYYRGREPDVCIYGRVKGVTLHKRDEVGHDLLLAAAQINLNQGEDSAVLRLDQLESGYYYVACGKERQSFQIVDRRPTPSEQRMAISLVACEDGPAEEYTLRSFSLHGIRVEAWPNCRFVATCTGTSGSSDKRFSADEQGRCVIQLSDLPIDEAATWCNLRARAWLARSNEIHLVSKPYVDSRDVSITCGWLRVKIRGVLPGTSGHVMLVAPQPWTAAVTTTPVTIGHGSYLEAKIPSPSEIGWLAILDDHEENAWLVDRVSGPQRFSVDDFRSAVQGFSDMPNQLHLLKVLDKDAPELLSFVRLSCLARSVDIPASNRWTPICLARWVVQEFADDAMTVRLPAAWAVRDEVHATLHLAGPKAELDVDGMRVAVRILPVKEGIGLEWLDPSGPCICPRCGSLMREREWWGHGHAHGGEIIGVDRVFDVEPAIDWAAALRTAKAYILDAVADNARSGPNILWSTWNALQESHRRLPPSRPSPYEWVDGTFDAAVMLSSLSAGVGTVDSWQDVCQHVEPFADGIAAISVLWRNVGCT